MIESLMDGKGFHGIVAVDGDKWKEQRRFSLSTLRDFGFGKTLMEDKISQETNLMLRELREKSEFADDCDVILPLKYCVGNIIASMAFGKTFPRGNNEFEAYQKHLDEVLRLLPKSQLLTFFPFLKYTCPNFFNYGKLMSLTKEIQGFLMAQISSHLTDEPTNTEISDIASAFAQEMRKQSSDANSFYTKTQLRFLILDLFAAGQETTVTTLSWAILYFLYHPEVQTKIQAEILEKVGGMPNWGDRLQLPYTCAVIAETQRISNIVPLGVQHETIEEVEIGGYKIPPKTMITSNLYSIHNDPKYFPNPEQFIPERFLDESGCLDKKKFDSLMPFSVGKRVCLGESLARMELFLILSALLINFSFEPVDKKNMPSLKPRFGVTVSPVPFKVKLIVRS